MAARSGMSDLISQLRGMVHAGTADYTVSGNAYWTDDQLQQILDRNRVDVRREKLWITAFYGEGGTVQYYDYYSEWENFEQTTGGTAIFWIENALGNNEGTANWTADYNRGMVTFASDTKGSSYYLTGRSYDLNGAAAEVWRQKMGHYAASDDSFDFSTDNMSVKRSQRLTQAKEMQMFYAAQSRPHRTIMYRSDINYGALT